jgi:hypothetical protein
MARQRLLWFFWPRPLGRGRFGPVDSSAKRLEKESAVKPGSVLDSHSSKDARRRAALATYPEAHVGHM